MIETRQISIEEYDSDEPVDIAQLLAAKIDYTNITNTVEIASQLMDLCPISLQNGVKSKILEIIV